VSVDNALVIEPHECDHVLDIVVGLDLPSSQAGAAWEHGVVIDAPLLEQVSPDRLWEPEMRRAVAVSMADLARPDREPNSPRLPGAATTPGHELISSVIRSLARSLPAHRSSPPNMRPQFRGPVASLRDARVLGRVL
jgi:hypothetical protein